MEENVEKAWQETYVSEEFNKSYSFQTLIQFIEGFVQILGI